MTPVRVSASRTPGIECCSQRTTEIRLWFHHQLSTPVGEMWQTINATLREHYQYYGINDNWPTLLAYLGKARRMAKRHLSEQLCELGRFHSLYGDWTTHHNAFFASLSTYKPMVDIICTTLLGLTIMSLLCISVLGRSRAAQ